MILLGVAAALFFISRSLYARVGMAQERLSQKIKEQNEERPDSESEEQKAWDAMWDEADAQIDEDFEKLLHWTSGIMRILSFVLLAGCVLILAVSYIL